MKYLQGIEVAARPWLYPLAEYGDTDLRQRLWSTGHMAQQQLSSIKQGWAHKITSRCVSYETDFELMSLLYDVALARQIDSIVAVA